MMQTMNIRLVVKVMHWRSYISFRMYLFGVMFYFLFCVPTDLSGFRLKLCMKVIYSPLVYSKIVFYLRFCLFLKN